MSQRSILILGASRHQLGVIRAAKQRGFTVITTDNNARNPGHILADKNFTISTTDVEAVVSLAKSLKVCGVVAAATDVSLSAAAACVERLGLNGPPTEVVSICCDKLNFREWQRRNQLPHPRFFRPSEVADLGSNPEMDLLLKPRKSSGGKGLCYVPKQRKFSQDLVPDKAEDFLYEEYLQGEHFTFEGIRQGGSFPWFMITKRLRASIQYPTTAGHILCTDQTHCSIKTAVEDVWKLLGPYQGLVDADVVLTKNGAFVLETTPRMGGNFLSQIALLGYGFSLEEAVVDFATGANPRHPNTGNNKLPTACYVFLMGAEKDGVLHYQPWKMQELKVACPGLHDIEVWVPCGSPVRLFRDSSNQLGFFSGRMENGRTAFDCQTAVLQAIQWRIS
jgi:biotin carboxylase